MIAGIAGLLIYFFLLVSLLGTAAEASDDADSVNNFARVWNEWAQVANNRQPGTISAHEYQLWERVKVEWRAAQRRIDPIYRTK
jgi:hypothetical protein